QAGRGDGPSASTLTDDWGFPIKATNLTQGWKFRGGSSPRDIYRTFTTGLNGTPMPSYVDSATEEERWHLANFIRSLSPEAKPQVKAVLRAKAVNRGLPSSPDDPLWNEAEPFFYPLVGQVIAKPRWFTPSIDSVIVKSLHNGEEIAFLLLWDDPTESAPQAGAEVFSDALAIQFPAEIPTSLGKPYFLRGDPRHPANLWRWQAHPAAVVEFNATGLGKLNVQPAESQHVTGQAQYDQGQWRLVLKRRLVSEDRDNDIQFEPDRFIPVAFIAWDGSAGERDGKGSLSTWYFLLPEKPTPLRTYSFIPISILLAAGFELWLVRTVRRRGAKTP
ncbi:MAG: ethylbenzene dehydrogenase-related protein, partial [Dehalococcoidia bacterium]